MLSKSAILVFLINVALGVASSELEASLARNRERRQVPSDQRAVSWPQIRTIRPSSNWAGAIWNQEGGTFKTVTGIFTVPQPQSSDYGEGAIWVGIDGDTCKGAILQGGIDFMFNGGVGSYKAWFEWLPDRLYYFDISIRGGDIIRATVTAITPISGQVTIENLTTDDKASRYVTSDKRLCLQDAEWILELIGNFPLGNYGTVTFTSATATGFNGVTYMPDGATTLLYIVRNDIIISLISHPYGETFNVKYADIAGCF